jgi:hypothetical protein
VVAMLAKRNSLGHESPLGGLQSKTCSSLQYTTVFGPRQGGPLHNIDVYGNLMLG